MKTRPYLFGIFWLLLIVATYYNLGEYFLLLTTAWFGLEWFCRKSYKIKYRTLNKFILFIAYYFVLSFIGLITGNVGLKNLIEFIMKYICLPLIIYELIPVETIKQEKMLRFLKVLVLLSAIYGLYESITGYNVLADVDVIQIKSRDWMIAMNSSQSYQPSSFFLHYNYYGCVLVLGIALGLNFSYKSKALNFVYWGIVLEQLLVCQSRICWISALFIAIIQIFRSKKITSKKFKRTIALLLSCVCIYIFEPNLYVSLFGMINDRFSRLWIYGFKDGSLGQRVGTLLNWPAYFGENICAGLFGTGYQSISVVFMDKYSYYKGYSTADCQLTVYLVETGIIGVVILAAAIISFLSQKNKIMGNESVFHFSKLALVAFLVECVTLDIVSNNFVLSLALLPVVIGYKRGRICNALQNVSSQEKAV